MNAHQTRKRARQFVAEVVKLLPEEYGRQLTAKMIEQEREIGILTRQLMRRDGFVLDSIDERTTL